MPAKKTITRKKQTRPVANTKNTNKRTWGIVVVVVLILLGGFFFYWTLGGGSTMGVRDSLASYLKDKYDKEFVVDQPHVTGAGIDMPGSWRAQAYPKDDPTLSFEVGETQKEGSFFDSYTSVVWQREEYPRVEAFLKSLSPPLSYQKIYLNTNLKSAQNPNPIRGNVPTIDEAIKQYGNQFNYSLGIKLSVKTLKNEQTKSDIRSQFYALNEFIKSRGVKDPGFGLSISATEENVGYDCSTSDIARLGSMDAMLESCLSKPAKRGVY